MGSRRPRSRRLLFAIVGVTVLLLFFIRRAGLIPGGEERFNPADYDDVVWIVAEDAGQYQGERVIVCGEVANTTFASETGGQPTYLNFERPYPDQPFDAVIWGRDRDRFPSPPEFLYANRSICVAGRVTSHRGVPRIEVRTPAQIEAH
ncbi:MAG: hypothetical protein EA351_09240 [Gemmatimonadales bacterium]|nr:MAG: hypothetical protein EA351_09240 [Gemmatimonadales bacterium]